MDKPIEKISNRINYALSIRGMTQAELSEKTKISAGSLSQYMNDRVQPKQDRIFILAKALSVSEAWLMGYDVPMERGKLEKVNTDALVDYIVDDNVKLLVERFTQLPDEKKQHVLKTLEFLLQ